MPDTMFKRSPAADPARLEQMKDILLRYPDIAEAERQELLAYLKKGPPLDTALLSTVDELRPKLAWFRADHRRHFELGARQYAIVAIILAGLVALFVWLWDSGLS